jgi:RHS repeat-associated protein
MVNVGSPAQYNERVSYYGVDGRLVAADARSAVGGTLVGHTAFEEYRYDALGRRILARVRRWCSDEDDASLGADYAPCMLSAIRRTVWSGSSELAEIQMPAGDATPADTVENDTLAVSRTKSATMAQYEYDANRAFGRVLYVHGMSTDQPVAITRVNYADATALPHGLVPYKVYAPFSIIPLWDARGHADRAVMGGTANPGGDRICADSTGNRCTELGILWGQFSYMLNIPDPGTWQGTLLVDKADATGTFYRRNRSYDPGTARFTQEDPLGLAGGVNLYGFAAGDPVNYSDPFGLCPNPDGSPCSPYAQVVDEVNSRMKDALADGLSVLFSAAKEILVNIGLVAATEGGSAIVGAVVEDARLGYMFGRATGRAHNLERAAQNASELAAIGIRESSGGKALIRAALEAVAGDSRSVAGTFTNKWGTYEVRESLIAGPGGFRKLESTWQVLPDGGRRFVTGIVKAPK